MSGQFNKIIGKTITGVYCRENEITPKGQVFITFDDGTYFEMYTMSDEIKGTKGLNTGVLDDVVSLNQEGKEICRYPVSDKIKIWVPPINLSQESRVVFGVPSDKEIDDKQDYLNGFFDQVQNLINQLPETEAANLIEEYFEDGGVIIDDHNKNEWGSEILAREEFRQLDIMFDIGFESISEEYQGLMLVPKDKLSFEKFLQVALVEFEIADDYFKLSDDDRYFKLSDDDRYLMNKMDELIVLALKRCDLTPKEIMSCGRLLYILRRLPLVTEGVFIIISFTVKDIPSLFLELHVTDEGLRVMLGSTEMGDTYYYIDWYVDMDGNRSDDNKNNDSDDVYYMEDNPFFRKEASIEVSIDNNSAPMCVE